MMQDGNNSVIFTLVYLLNMTIFIFVLVSVLKLFLCDPILGTFSFDDERIVIYNKTHVISFRFDDCKEIGLTRWLGGGTLSNHQFIYYVYFSKTRLTKEQRYYLFQRRNESEYKNSRLGINMPRYKSEYIMIQYTPEVFKRIIECVPLEFRDNLVQKEKSIILSRYEQWLNQDDPSLDEKESLLVNNNNNQCSEDKKSIKNEHRFSNQELYKTSITVRRQRAIAVAVWLLILLFGIAGFFDKHSTPTSIIVSKMILVLSLLFGIIIIGNSLFNYLLGKFSFDTEGISFRNTINHVYFPYDECVKMRIIRRITRYNVVHFICVSKNDFPNTNDKWLVLRPQWLAKKRRNLQYKKDYMVFEYYDAVVFKEFLECVPKRFREQLCIDEETLIAPLAKDFFE